MSAKLPLKDYYRILKIPRDASSEDIKKSYHELVFHFHPDKNRDNAFATEYFLEIQEAYEVISKPLVRKAYDYDLINTGLARPKKREVSPKAILKQSQELSTDIRRMNAYRIDMPWLQLAVKSLLSNQHIAILSEAGLFPLRDAFLSELMIALKILRYPYPEEISKGVEALAALDKTSHAKWSQFLKVQHRRYLIRIIIPWIALITTLILCTAMYYYGRK